MSYTKIAALVASVAWWAIACGTSSKNQEADAGSAGRTDGGADGTPNGSPDMARTPDMGRPNSSQAALVFANFAESGQFQLLDLTQGLNLSPIFQPTNSDAVANWTLGGFRVINRIGGNSIQSVNEDGTLQAAISTGENTNPQAVVVTEDGTTFVSLYEADAQGRHLIWFNPGATTVSGGLNLVDYTDPSGDHLPRVSPLFYGAGLVVALLQQLGADFSPTYPGVFVAVDPVTKEVVASDDLAGRNPGGVRYCPRANYAPEYQRAFISHQGDYGANGAGGGVEVLDLSSGVPVSTGIKITAKQLGGGAGPLALSEDRGHVVNLGSFPSAVHWFELADPTTLGGLLYTSSGFISELAFAQGYGLMVPKGNKVVLVDEGGTEVMESTEGPFDLFSVATN